MSWTARVHPCLVKIYSSRTMSFIAHERVFEGNRWRYRLIDALGGDGTHSSTVFKAEILPYDSAQNAPKWFAV
jgi:hypothetical protein